MAGLPETSPHRDATGRFLPGRSGNPAGKKPGTRNRATLLREALNEGEDRAAARLVIDKALEGNLVAARFIVDRLMPRPRGREIEIELPDGAGARDSVAGCGPTVPDTLGRDVTSREGLAAVAGGGGGPRGGHGAARGGPTRGPRP